MTTEPPPARRVVIAGRPSTAQYGRYFWQVDKPGGGFASVYANRAELDNGHAVFYGCNHAALPNNRVDYDQPESPEYVLIAFPPGQWTAFYAASVIDGSPVAVDKWEEAA